MHQTDRTANSTAARAEGIRANVDRETIAGWLSSFAEGDKDSIRAVMGDPRQDEALFDGLEHYLNGAAQGKFLNTLKLEKIGEWLGNSAPARLQIRIMEIARSSHHPAFQAFRTGAVRSGGLERAYPKA